MERPVIALYASPGASLAAIAEYARARPLTTDLACLRGDRDVAQAVAAMARACRTVQAVGTLVESAHALVAWWSPQDARGREVLATAWNTWLPIRLFSADGCRTFQRIETH